MPQIVTMPSVVADSSEATLHVWHVAPGDQVSAGAPLGEIETEKAVIELTSPAAGTVARLLAEAGASVPVGEPVAVVLEAGETEADLDAALDVSAQTSRGKEPVSASHPEPGDVPESRSETEGTPARTFISPLARRRAKELGLAPESIAGSGPGGRIVRADVERAADPVHELQAAEAPDHGTLPETGPSGRREPLTPMRRAIANRVTTSKSTIPHFYLATDLQVDELLRLRSELNTSQETLGGARITVNDLLLKALGHALREVPEANTIWNGDAITRFDHADVAIAVATSGGGLLTPVVKGVETLSLGALAARTQELKSRAEQGRITGDELEGGSFSLTNLGMYGIREFYAIVNPPHSGILAAGSTRRVPVITDTGEVSSRSVMTVTLSADHRIIDGAVAARLLNTVQRCVEHPLSMLI
ncbi:dihydrolipoamide acetyltransferase family protein [Nesterenkonia ebinurensis]|uniref:dihydrolipoamide acetyltransferase family protein n=1 Tax=Nesterenkonia ebinurensis TaxID=2608252 RepID=UPI00123DACA5|nr:dihydrolipoamide acetyltransferase family protein [Nesterenkonia ebinurensis]